jgi:EAL domain-containing protein (putative c-di-GMP-specific phosphodiesterase class I)
MSAATPLCFILDRDFAVRHTMAKELRLVGVDVVEVSDSSRFMDLIDHQNPDIVVVNVNRTAPHECVRALWGLKECSYGGSVQLFGQCDLEFLESMITVGKDCSLKMLAPLQTPIKIAALHRIILDRKARSSPAPANTIPLREALAKNLVQFQYQPKFNLKEKTIAGAELVARVAHPEHGFLTPDQFMKGADEEALLDLARLVLVHAVKASARFLEQGVSLQLAINISADSLLNLPTYDLVQLHRPERDDWPGLVIEIPERQVVGRIDLLKARAIKLQQMRVSIAIDNFGRGSWNFDVLNQMPFAEIKIDRSLIEGCATNPGNRKICKTLIQMAHNFDVRTVAVGISSEMDFRLLSTIDCDLGQGFLLGKPMAAQDIVIIARSLNVQPAAVS